MRNFMRKAVQAIVVGLHQTNAGLFNLFNHPAHTLIAALRIIVDDANRRRIAFHSRGHGMEAG